MIYSQEVQHMCVVKKGATTNVLRFLKKESGFGQLRSPTSPV